MPVVLLERSSGWAAVPVAQASQHSEESLTSLTHSMRATTTHRSRPAQATSFRCVYGRSVAALVGVYRSLYSFIATILSSPRLESAHLLILALQSRDAVRTMPGRSRWVASVHANVRGRLVTRWRSAACPHAAAVLLVRAAVHLRMTCARGRVRSGDRSSLVNSTPRCHSRRPPACSSCEQADGRFRVSRPSGSWARARCRCRARRVVFDSSVSRSIGVAVPCVVDHANCRSNAVSLRQGLISED